MDFEELVRNGFEIRNGEVRDRNGNYTPFSLRKEAWSNNSYIIVGNYSSHDYSMKKAQWSGDWYLYRGYAEVCKLYYHGGENWTTY